jgi:outer membrane protein assembly factor BamB
MLRSTRQRLSDVRPRTIAVAGVLFVVLAAIAVVTFAGSGGSLEEQWISDTPRDNEVNHHAVGVEDGVVVVPVAAVVGTTEITDTSCSLVRLDPDDGTVQWRAGVQPANCTTHALTEPAIEDIDGDGDGDLEVVASSTEQALAVLDAETGTEEWRVGLSSYGYGQPGVANLTTDPGHEIVAVDISGQVVAAHNGSAIWRYDLNNSAWADPIVRDFDADGTSEILVGTNDETALLSASGHSEWTVPVEATTTAVSTPAGGTDTTVFVAGTGHVVALDGATGERQWHYTVDGTAAVHDTHDGMVYVGISGGEVVALDATSGDRQWRFTFTETDQTVTPPPVSGDVTGDGTAEVVAVNSDGSVAVLSQTGEQLGTYERDVPIWTFPTVADVDGDGAAEIFVRYGDGRVAMLTYE